MSDFACKLSDDGGTTRVRKIDIQGVCPGMSGLMSVNAIPMIECQRRYGEVDAVGCNAGRNAGCNAPLSFYSLRGELRANNRFR